MNLRLWTAVAAFCALSLLASVGFGAGTDKEGGLSKAEATVIAHRFFAEKIDIEAVMGEPTLQGDHWAFPLKVGYANRVARDPILVNRFTREASWAGLAQLNATRNGKAPPK